MTETTSVPVVPQVPRTREMIFHLLGEVGTPCKHHQRGQADDFINLKGITACMLAYYEEAERLKKEGVDLRPRFVINSHGGDCSEGESIYAYLSALPIPITTIGVGVVESAGTLVYLGGKQRLATPTTTFLFHAIRRDFRRISPVELKAEAKNYYQSSQILAATTARALGNKPEDMRRAQRWGRGEHRLTAEQALQYGVVHEITETMFSADSLFWT